VRLGAGAYICGEETSLLEASKASAAGALQAAAAGDQGPVRLPTVINNVITFASVPIILARGARSTATSAWAARAAPADPARRQHQARRPGRKAFGVTLRELLDDYRRRHALRPADPRGAGRRAARRLLAGIEVRHAARLRGLRRSAGMLGHGGIVVFDDTVDMAAQARFAMEFCAIESCGKCTPCRIGSTRGVEVIDQDHRGRSPRAKQSLLRDLCDTMT
jgi:formate dehydrogenase iron-sulfur subunit